MIPKAGRRALVSFGTSLVLRRFGRILVSLAAAPQPAGPRPPDTEYRRPLIGQLCKPPPAPPAHSVQPAQNRVFSIEYSTYDLGDASRPPGGRPGRVRVRHRSPEASRERPSAVPGPKLDTKSVQFWLKSRLAVVTVLTVLPDPGARAQTHALGPRQRTGPP